jgi:hypothetical protein
MLQGIDEIAGGANINQFPRNPPQKRAYFNVINKFEENQGGNQRKLAEFSGNPQPSSGTARHATVRICR